MRKSTIFYFSGTGNTWWVSRELTRLLRKKDIDVHAYSIEALTAGEANALVKKCNLAGFGYPIYGSDLPQPMKEFINKLEPVQGKVAFVFCTQYLWSGDGARIGSSFLKTKGFQVIWGEHFLMPNNVTVSLLLPLPYTNEQSKLKGILSRTGSRLQHFAACISEERSFRRGFNPISCLLGSLQRVPFRLVYNKLRDNIGIDPLSCTRCGECTLLCPSGNLVFNGSNISTGGSCILCLRCYNFCSATAITYRGRPHNKRRGEPYKGPVEGFNPKILKQKQQPDQK